jgi:hypothetical protein
MMLRPLLGSARLREVQRVEGGLVNTICRVTADADGVAYAVQATPSPSRPFCGTQNGYP